MSNLLKKILVSEKSFASVANGKFTFVVAKNAAKEDIAKACQSLFNVTVLAVNTMNYQGKIKSTKKNKGKRADFKKVVLTLKPGDSIDLFEVEKDEPKADKKKKKNAKSQTESAEKKIKDDVEVKVKEKK